MNRANSTLLKGSQKLIQILINEHPELLQAKIFEKIELGSPIRWLSPLKEDAYKEYQDVEFLDILGLQSYASSLKEFWPKSGPRWDGLGTNSGQQYFLVEAKANISEIFSSCGASDPESINLIQASLEETKEYLGCQRGLNWYDGFYQYANRISHLYFLREKCGLDVYMIFLYFCNDWTHIPTTYEEWGGALQVQKQIMSLYRYKLKKYVLELFVNAKMIRSGD